MVWIRAFGIAGSGDSAGSLVNGWVGRRAFVTYVRWGLEAMRGSDIYMKVARRIYEVYPDILFVVIGADQTYYGGDERYIQHATFKEHVLNQDAMISGGFVSPDRFRQSSW